MTVGEGIERVAIVTGGAGGIGRAIREELATMGYRTWSLDLETAPGDAVAVDVTDESAVAEAIAQIPGRVDVLVTAAGTYVEVPATEITSERWEATLRLHLGGTAAACRAVLPRMLAEDRGHIVAITSDLALSGAPNAADYAAAKGAVIGFVRALALELASTGVRANLVAPGPTDTPMIPEASHYRERPYLDTVPIRRLVDPGEVSRAVRFLVEDGDFYVGQVVSPNGGVAI